MGPPVGVAVVIPARDAASYLGQALASVAAQTRAPQAVVVVDDASVDATSEVAEAWAPRLPLQIVRLAQSKGAGAARHEGITHCEMPLLALLDADDVWFPDHLDTLLEVHDQWGGLVTADALAWLPGEALATEPLSVRLPLPRPEDQRHELLDHNYVFSGTLFGRDLYERAGGFRAALRIAEDWDLWIRMVRAGAVVSRPDHPTALRRLRHESASDTDDLAAAQVRVLELALIEAITPEETAAARHGLRRARATRALYRAYGAAEAGRSLAARAAALGALRGNRRVGLRAALMAVAPRRVAARRATRRYTPRWWVDR